MKLDLLIDIDAIPQLSLLPLFISAGTIEAFPVASRTTVVFLQRAIGGVTSTTVKLMFATALFPA